MTEAGASVRARLPGADWLSRAFALTAGALLLCGYGIFLALGPAVAAPFLATTLGVALAVFLALLARRPAALLVFGAIFLTLALASVFTLIHEWDARSIWFYHARFLADGMGAREFLSLDASFSHPQYPKMLALVAATVARSAGFWNEALPKLAVPILLSVPLAYMLGAWGSRFARLLLLAATLLICGRYLYNGYVDAILAVYAVAALGAGLRYLEFGERLDGFCFAVFVAMLPTLKTEGALACAAILVALAVRTLATGEWRRTPRILREVGPPLVLALAIALGWFVLVKLHHAISEDILVGDPWSRLVGRLGDGASLWQIWRAMFLDEARGAWLVAALLLFAFGTPAVRRSAGPFIVAAVVFLAALTVVYLMTNSGLVWHLATSVHRTTLLPVLLLAAGLVPFGGNRRPDDGPHPRDRAGRKSAMLPGGPATRDAPSSTNVSQEVRES